MRYISGEEKHRQFPELTDKPETVNLYERGNFTINKAGRDKVRVETERAEPQVAQRGTSGGILELGTLRMEVAQGEETPALAPGASVKVYEARARPADAAAARSHRGAAHGAAPGGGMKAIRFRSFHCYLKHSP